MPHSNISIEDVPLNRFHHLMTLRSGGGWVMDGYILSIVGVALMQLSEDLNLNDFWQGMIAASSLIGIAFGGFLGGALTDRLGRQKLYFVPPLIFITCSVAQFWVESREVLFALRFLIGIGVGIEYPVTGSLLVEFLPKDHRGPRLSFLVTLWYAGAALAYIAGNYLLANGGAEAWRLVMASPAVLGFLLLLVRLGTPESPRWLLGKGRSADAERIIQKVYGPAFSLRNLPELPPEKPLSFKRLLHSGYGKRMLFVAIFWTCSVTPVFAVYAFVPRVLQALNFTGSWASYGSIAITTLFVVGCVAATCLINIMGRRSLVIQSFLWASIALTGLGFYADGPAWLILLLFCSYAFFSGGTQVLQIVYPNEIFPTEIRAFAVGMGASLSRVGAATGTWLVPIALRSIGIGNTMFVAAAISLVGLLVSVALAPETRSMTLQEAASLDR